MADKITSDKVIRAFLDASFMRSEGNTSLADIADILHIKKASLYNHFESRDDIVEKTLESCSDYLAAINFIPGDIASVANKYPADTVLKGIISRYVKMHEKSPLFQIYTFVESMKYFNRRATEIIAEENKKLIEQTEKTLIELAKVGKISLSEDKIRPAAKWFVAGINDLLSNYLMARKQVVMANPQSGDGELFQLEPDEKGIEKINLLVEEFCRML
ncbi:TetR/AcrR family transcriptional regulator [Treponema sp.]|uniref:TetR/AcrR family transcriptional regulator n=1 Tax=Treponema sp. TaxID=166 RepID=UPI00298E4766|nr:TetR/AcrR family transcriptional regulator [Treponema sp.]MCQ2240658.1 TetR/AcrR family transcriptional regulator [Treponema sp.]